MHSQCKQLCPPRNPPYSLQELGLMDADSLGFRHSSLAAAALLLGHVGVESHAAAAGCVLGLPPLTATALQALAPGLCLQQVMDACKLLSQLHAAACTQPPLQKDAPAQGPALARSKYSADVWHNVAAWPQTLDLRAALERF
jgi:hypothetical protein